MAAETKSMRNYYVELGVLSTASEEDISEAYTKLAQEYNHRNEEDDTKFVIITEAFRILSNKHKRHKFDAELTNPDFPAAPGHSTDSGLQQQRESFEERSASPCTPVGANEIQDESQSRAVTAKGVNTSPTTTNDLTFPLIPVPPKALTIATIPFADIYFQQFEKYVLDYQKAMSGIKLHLMQFMEVELLSPRFSISLRETDTKSEFGSYQEKTKKHMQVLNMCQKLVLDHLRALDECEESLRTVSPNGDF
jgi:curved DNA-binding protein CbpA